MCPLLQAVIVPAIYTGSLSEDLCVKSNEKIERRMGSSLFPIWNWLEIDRLGIKIPKVAMVGREGELVWKEVISQVLLFCFLLGIRKILFPALVHYQVLLQRTMRIQDLEIENRHLRETLNDYSREFKVVRNQGKSTYRNNKQLFSIIEIALIIETTKKAISKNTEQSFGAQELFWPTPTPSAALPFPSPTVCDVLKSTLRARLQLGETSPATFLLPSTPFLVHCCETIKLRHSSGRRYLERGWPLKRSITARKRGIKT
ncbi:hypothetical protein CEXT_611691 [Caerostris extrusa]|uniref:Uncharacterized protein n=1 Tax=Caerostris extrusa TaxID=172846 RepID=A0AAV4TST3_CAEEX|nr:hypothetical protein CEXT_611691 [Caerostris extrusa]